MSAAAGAGRGRVILVGAGPGDPSLATLAAVQALRDADMVLYDHLAPAALLREARPDAERLYVGKRAGAHSLTQEQINEILLRAVGEGKVVVRLKGGDPYIFGRGAEEASALASHGVRFQIVPGITAATAASLYAGIPLTDRRFSATVTFVAGHTASDDAAIPWDALVAGGGTLVFYMGVRTMGAIAERLLHAGMDPQMPTAVVENAAMPCQRTLTAPLATIAEVSAAQGVRSPALLLVGRVVDLHPGLAWYEQLPLFGRRIAVTRAAERSGDMGQQLRALGAEVFEVPTIRMQPLELSAADALRLRDVGRYDYLVLTSPAAAELFFARLRAYGLDSRALGAVRVAAVGEATVAELERHGVSPDVVPPEYVGESLLETLEAEGSVAGRRALVPRSGRARTMLVDGLRRAGLTVDEVRLYEPVPAETSREVLLDALGRDLDLVTFTSGSTVDHLVGILGAEAFARYRDRIGAASIGPVTSRALRRHGLEPVVEAAVHSARGLIEAMEAWSVAQRAAAGGER